MNPQSRVVVLGAIMALIFITSIPTAEAQSRRYDRDDWERWRDTLEESEEGTEVFEEPRSSRRGYSNATQEKIDDLDNDEVETFPIPILFGVTLTDLFPNFGDPRDGGARSHEGLDIMGIEEVPVVSPTNAVVTRTGSGSSAGRYVYTANPGGETFAYMHLTRIADIDVGDELEPGDVIGYVGNTGNASGGPAHLHFEIRENRRAKDPYERITETFTLKEKISFLGDILKDVSDDEEYAEFLVDNFRAELLAARALKLTLPDAIDDELGTAPVISTNTRDLDLGASGSDVTALQTFLIEKGYSIPAGATGYFGAQTQSALVAFQKANGITPAVGYYGPRTRAQIAAL